MNEQIQTPCELLSARERTKELIPLAVFFIAVHEDGKHAHFFLSFLFFFYFFFLGWTPISHLDQTKLVMSHLNQPRHLLFGYYKSISLICALGRISVLHLYVLSKLLEGGGERERVSQLVSWCFKPSQPQRITSGLDTNFTLSPSQSFHKSSYHKVMWVFLTYLYSADTQHGNLHPAG